MNKSLTFLRLLLKGIIIFCSIPYYILYLVISWIVLGKVDFKYVSEIIEIYLFEIKDFLGMK
jgi:hypothetical protein